MRKITSLLMLFCMFVGTAWAQTPITLGTNGSASTTWNTGTWKDAGAVPAGVISVESSQHPDRTSNVKLLSMQVTVPAGSLSTTLIYTAGGNRLDILGVDITDVEESSTVVSQDYHFGFSGGNKKNNTYTVEVPENGTYQIRYWVSFCYEANTSTGDITLSHSTLFGGLTFNLTSDDFRLKTASPNITSALYMTVTEANNTNQDRTGITLQSQDNEKEQVFCFEVKDGVFRLKSDKNNYGTTFASWGYSAYDVVKDGSEHMIEPVDEGVFRLKGPKGYIGSNNNDAGYQEGAYIYSNHTAGSKEHVKWTAELIDPSSSAAKFALLTEISYATSLYMDLRNKGCAVSLFADVVALKSAVENAVSVYNSNESVEDDYNEQLTVLKETYSSINPDLPFVNEIIPDFELGNYLIYYTDDSGVKHFLQTTGANTVVTVTENPKAYELSVGEGSRYNKSYLLKMNGQYISNTSQNATNIETKTQAQQWSSQVIFKLYDKYAIRLTNATDENGWHGHYFIDKADGDAVVGADPSKGVNLFFWTIEEEGSYKLKEAISEAKATFKDFNWGDSFPYVSSSYNGEKITSSAALDAVLNSAKTVEEVNTMAEEIEASVNCFHFIRMYNAGRYKENSQKWYVSGTTVIENANENSLFEYNVLTGTLKQVATGKYLVHGVEAGDCNQKASEYSVTENIEEASSFTFTPSTRSGLTYAWVVSDGTGYMCDWGGNRQNKVFSHDHANDDWATWGVEVEKQGHFYYLKGSNNRYLTINGATNGTTTLQTSAEECAEAIFYFEPSTEDTKFYMVSYKNGTYVANPWRNGIGTDKINDKEVYKQEWELVDAGNGKHKLFYANQFYMGVNGEGTNGTANGDGEAYEWTLVPVEKLPITITAAGYASFYSPIAVELPVEGLKAYYVSSVEGEWAKFTEITGTIPANTGVLLAGEENSYDLNIAVNVASIVGNKLAGTVASTYVTTESYVLSAQNGAVGFYRAAMNKNENQAFLNNGFKAYLPASEVNTNANALRFNFGGNTTAIESVLNNGVDANAPIYDLSGRRVMNAVKGGIYIQNGKKFIVK